MCKPQQVHITEQDLVQALHCEHLWWTGKSPSRNALPSAAPFSAQPEAGSPTLPQRPPPISQGSGLTSKHTTTCPVARASTTTPTSSNSCQVLHPLSSCMCSALAISWLAAATCWCVTSAGLPGDHTDSGPAGGAAAGALLAAARWRLLLVPGVAPGRLLLAPAPSAAGVALLVPAASAACWTGGKAARDSCTALRSSSNARRASPDQHQVQQHTSDQIPAAQQLRT